MASRATSHTPACPAAEIVGAAERIDTGLAGIGPHVATLLARSTGVTATWYFLPPTSCKPDSRSSLSPSLHRTLSSLTSAISAHPVAQETSTSWTRTSQSHTPLSESAKPYHCTRNRSASAWKPRVPIPSGESVSPTVVRSSQCSPGPLPICVGSRERERQRESHVRESNASSEFSASASKRRATGQEHHKQA